LTNANPFYKKKNVWHKLLSQATQIERRFSYPLKVSKLKHLSGESHDQTFPEVANLKPPRIYKPCEGFFILFITGRSDVEIQNLPDSGREQKP
jgi:hypothetical protein